jgi:hypothetical protein
MGRCHGVQDALLSVTEWLLFSALLEGDSLPQIIIFEGCISQPRHGFPLCVTINRSSGIGVEVDTRSGIDAW